MEIRHMGLILDFDQDGNDSITIYDKEGHFLFLINKSVVKKWKEA